MRLRTLALVCLSILTLPALAGCVNGTLDTAEDQSDPVIVTRPDDYSYVQNETGAASATDRAHVHDYWNGKSLLPVVDATLESGTECIGGPCTAAIFQPEPGHIVPLGTSHLTITVHWQAPPYAVFEGLELWVKTASDSEPAFFVDLANGEALRFESSNAMNDIPHQVLSAWEFHIVAQPSGDAFLRMDGVEFAMQASAHRGLDIPPYPAHPDFWTNGTERPLIGGHETDTEARLVGGSGDDGTTYGFGNPLFPFAPDDGLIVPFDATHVLVTMAYDWETPHGLELYHHGADTREWTLAPVESDDGSTRVHRIPVQQDGDSPYASQSLWRFWLRADDEAPVLGEGVFRGETNVTATVHKEA